MHHHLLSQSPACLRQQHITWYPAACWPLQKLPVVHSFSGWAAARAAAVSGKFKADLEVGSEASSEEDSSSDWMSWQQDHGGQHHQLLHQQDLATTTSTSLTALLPGAAESVVGSGQWAPMKPGYIGVDQLMNSRMSISR
jgi:hypothetical protein